MRRRDLPVRRDRGVHHLNRDAVAGHRADPFQGRIGELADVPPAPRELVTYRERTADDPSEEPPFSRHRLYFALRTADMR